MNTYERHLEGRSRIEGYLSKNAPHEINDPAFRTKLSNELNEMIEELNLEVV